MATILAHVRGIPVLLIAVVSQGCTSDSHTGVPANQATLEIPPPSLEDSGYETFVMNCNNLRKSNAFRQNVCLNFNQDGHGLICMDLEHQLYLVVRTRLPVRPATQLSERFKNLRISTTALRKRMDPAAFALNASGEDPTDGIFFIPADATESFAADLFSELLGLELSPRDIWYRWD